MNPLPIFMAVNAVNTRQKASYNPAPTMRGGNNIIPFVQVATPNVNVPAQSGWCLQYVDDGVNAPVRQPSAQASWEYAKKTGVAHANEEPPNNVWVPVYYSIDSGFYAGLGHVAWYYSDGKVTKIYDSEYGSKRRSKPYGSGAELINFMGYKMRYLGWSEAVDGKTIVRKDGKQEAIKLFEEGKMFFVEAVDKKNIYVVNQGGYYSRVPNPTVLTNMRNAYGWKTCKMTQAELDTMFKKFK